MSICGDFRIIIRAGDVHENGGIEETELKNANAGTVAKEPRSILSNIIL
ncbi:hypothetical protein BofuT4_uP083830.1 [Botrytis cinerea T4]|uniref:Uncharacterized protein n=1 Tax=Botryotinia fuckeliana (strain T4) TaxID=999810 RepID=G2YJR3_BOTF4|nr:hypothetical protein BofuT4_uP083830.1 [Botrytis cinerea T4]